MPAAEFSSEVSTGRAENPPVRGRPLWGSPEETAWPLWGDAVAPLRRPSGPFEVEDWPLWGDDVAPLGRRLGRKFLSNP